MLTPRAWVDAAFYGTLSGDDPEMDRDDSGPPCVGERRFPARNFSLRLAIRLKTLTIIHRADYDVMQFLIE